MPCRLPTGRMRQRRSGKRVDSLENRLEIVEKTLTEINSGISSLQTIVEALQNGKSVSNVEETADGLRHSFSDGSTITLKHGKDGANGQDGTNGRTQLPRLSVWMSLKELITGLSPSTVKPNSWKTTEKKVPLQVIPRKSAWIINGYWTVDTTATDRNR